MHGSGWGDTCDPGGSQCWHSPAQVPEDSERFFFSGGSSCGRLPGGWGRDMEEGAEGSPQPPPGAQRHGTGQVDPGGGFGDQRWGFWVLGTRKRILAPVRVSGGQRGVFWKREGPFGHSRGIWGPRMGVYRYGKGDAAPIREFGDLGRGFGGLSRDPGWRFREWEGVLDPLKGFRDLSWGFRVPKGS